MNDFTASNGMRLVQREGGSTYDLLSSDGDNMFEDAAWLGRQDMDALREFFQAEADERLGRWRHGDFVVYDRGDYVQVIHEPDGASGMLGSWTRAEVSGDHVMGSGFRDAARAYFDAHPEPKPWHDAKPSEVWQIATASTGPDLYVVENTGNRFIHVERRLLALEVTAAEIVSGRRIWPEVSS